MKHSARCYARDKERGWIPRQSWCFRQLDESTRTFQAFNSENQIPNFLLRHQLERMKNRRHRTMLCNVLLSPDRKKHFLSLKSHKKEWEENFSDIKIINLLTFSLSLSPSHIYSRSTYFPHIKWNGVETKSSCFSSVTFSVCDVNIVRWFELIDVLLVRRYFFLVWINDTVSVIAVWRRRVCLCRDLFSGASKSFCNHKTVDSITKWENLGSSIAITYHKCRINVETAETLIS